MQGMLCFGFGFSASFLARELLGAGWRVAGTARSDKGLSTMRAAGVEAWPFERTRPLPVEAFSGISHILVSVPPDEAGDPVLDAHCADFARLSGLTWVGYLSTTGVYGDRDGAWVDEEADLRPDLTRSRHRAEAEAAWLDLAHSSGIPVHIFRLAGIYGPGRSAIDSMRNGTARRIVKPGQVFSRIHVADIAQVLQASIAKPDPGRIYNVCDDDPAPPQDVIAHAAELLGLPAPPDIPFEQAELSPMARSFYADNKRVSNARIKAELGVRLRYPSYREGLRAILAG